MVRCGGRGCVSGGSVVCRGSVLGRGGMMCASCVLSSGFGRVIITTAAATRAIIKAPININDTKAYIRKVRKEAHRQIKAPTTVIGACDTRVDNLCLRCFTTIRDGNSLVAVRAWVGPSERRLRERNDKVRIRVRLTARSHSKTVPGRTNTGIRITTLSQIGTFDML